MTGTMPSTESNSIGASARKAAHTAIVGLDDATTGVLSACFQQFGIVGVAFPCTERERLLREKFEGCVLRLDDSAERVLSTLRSSPSNFRAVVYGLASSTAQALRFSRYTINAILDDPLDSRAALRAVRNTHLLVLHEFRRYVRVPLVTAVHVITEDRSISGQSHEISGGGMSLKVAAKVPVGSTVELDFELPNRPRFRIAGTVRWLREGFIGVRFEEKSPARRQVRDWIDEFLGIA